MSERSKFKRSSFLHIDWVSLDFFAAIQLSLQDEKGSGSKSSGGGGGAASSSIYPSFNSSVPAAGLYSSPKKERRQVKTL